MRITSTKATKCIRRSLSRLGEICLGILCSKKNSIFSSKKMFLEEFKEIDYSVEFFRLSNLLSVKK